MNVFPWDHEHLVPKMKAQITLCIKILLCFQGAHDFTCTVNSYLVLNKFLEWSSRNRASMQQSKRVQIAWLFSKLGGYDVFPLVHGIPQNTTLSLGYYV